MLLIVPHESPLRFDPELGFHLYGADLCIQARERGLAVVALKAPCRHDSRTGGLPGSFFPSARAFARKWADRLPLATSCVLFDDRGRLFLLGNADPKDGTTAGPEGAPLLGEPGEFAIGGPEDDTARRTPPGDHVRVSATGLPVGSGSRPRLEDLRPVRTTHSRAWSQAAIRPCPELSTGVGGDSPCRIDDARGLASIIIPCFNQREFTRLCLQALFRHTRPSWELIVIDNGSTDGTGEYLAGVQDAAPVPVTVVSNSRNLGFPAAVNQGLKAARGEYLVLLNNDAVVTDGWLDQLIALTRIRPVGDGIEAPGCNEGPENGDRHPASSGCEPVPAGVGPGASPHFPLGGANGPLVLRTIGMVGPMSNYAAPPQLVERVPYRDLDEMHAFARSWRDESRGKWFTAAKLSGFCVLIARAVYDAIGGLDERFGLGLFDDDDLAERARRAGFELAVAHDLFVHHFGSRTFVGNGIDAEALLLANERQFADKWGHDRPRGRRVALRPWSGDPRSHLSRDAGPESAVSRNGEKPAPPPSADDGRRARVTLTMIVRDEEKNLRNCLGSVRGIFDEIVVVDTGSVDQTVEIAREFGARVFDFVWVDDFAAARNAALARATGDFAFWLDADDVVEPPEREKLRALLAGLHPGEDVAFVVRCACDPGEDGSGGETVVDHIRLFPVREGVRWTYRVHEQILPALRRARIDVRWTDLTVRHTGYTDRALRARKLLRDARILRDELAERPDDPFVLFNLGAIAIEQKDWREALKLLNRSLAGSAPTDSITRKLYALIARAHQMLGEPQQALSACGAGLALDPEDAELLFREAVVRRHTGDPDGAERCWRRILTLRRPEQFASLDQGIYGHLTRRNLAALAAERGDHAEADRLWAQVLADCPGDREATAAVRRTPEPVRIN